MLNSLFEKALDQEVGANKPLVIIGVINALIAKFAQDLGVKAIYLSGSGIAATRYALPDLGLINLNDLVTEISAIRENCQLPLLVDLDTAGDNPLNVARTIKLVERAGANAVHIEDQTLFKRCGHRDNKSLVSTAKMSDRIKAALDSRLNNLYIIARTDALASKGADQTLQRVLAYQKAGADAIFLEASIDLKTYDLFSKELSIPILANITEFGKTPIFTQDELFQSGVKMVLYPLSVMRAMNLTAINTINKIIKDKSQTNLIDSMQTREDLYKTLNYTQQEKIIDNYYQED